MIGRSGSTIGDISQQAMFTPTIYILRLTLWIVFFLKISFSYTRYYVNKGVYYNDLWIMNMVFTNFDVWLKISKTKSEKKNEWTSNAQCRNHWHPLDHVTFLCVTIFCICTSDIKCSYCIFDKLEVIQSHVFLLVRRGGDFNPIIYKSFAYNYLKICNSFDH